MIEVFCWPMPNGHKVHILLKERGFPYEALVVDMCLACPEGIEPPTHSLEGWCSLQLSYGQMNAKMAPTGPFSSTGRSDRIRTYDPLVPNQMRYQTAPRSEVGILAVPLHLKA